MKSFCVPLSLRNTFKITCPPVSLHFLPHLSEQGSFLLLKKLWSWDPALTHQTSREVFAMLIISSRSIKVIYGKQLLNLSWALLMPFGLPLLYFKLLSMMVYMIFLTSLSLYTLMISSFTPRILNNTLAMFEQSYRDSWWINCWWRLRN